jgi:hypothetical protein
MKTSLIANLLISVATVPSFAHAALSDPHYAVQVADIEIVNDGTNNAIYVRGTFTPTLPCSVQGFVYFANDAFQKDVTAILLVAKSTGRPVSFTHSYCISGTASNGYGRGNGYVLK